MAIRILSSENITGNLTLSGNQTTGGNAYVTGTSNSLVVISRDNMFVDAGQFYLGADDGTTDDSFRQRTASGSYFIESRKSGTWTNRLQINTAGTLIVQQGMAISGNIDGVGATFIGTAASGAALVTIENNSGSTATSYGLLVLGGGNSSSGRTFEVRDASGNTDLIVKGDGNVGINTATPQKKVHIEGTGGASEMQILVSSASDTVGHTAGIGLRGEGGEADGDFRIKGGIFFERIAGSFGNGKMILAVNSSVSNTSVTVADHALTIDTNKNVGIGTASPDYKLDVRNGELTVRPSSSGNVGLGKIGHSSNNAILQLYDSLGNEDVRISTSLNSYFNGGNVGIGTTSPVNKLGIEVAANSNTKAINIYSKNTSPNSYTSIGSQYSISNTYVESEIRFGNETQNGGGSYLGFVAGATNSGNTERMRIDSSGKIAIGNNIPMWSGQYGGALFLKGNNATSDRYVQLTTVDSTGASIGTGLVVKGISVGIGTEEISNLLSIKGSGQNWSTSPAIKLWDTTYGKGWFVGTANNDVAGDYYIRSVTAQTAYPVAADQQFTIKQNGNIGIGTIAPGQKLAIEGGGTANENILRVNNQGQVSSRIWLRNAGQSAYIFNSGPTPDTLATGILGQAFGMGINNNSSIQFYNGATASVKMTILPSGNVGIGRTQADEKLEVEGNIKAKDVDGKIYSMVASWSYVASKNDLFSFAGTEGAVWEYTIRMNPNTAGSGAYRDFYYGKLGIGMGWNGSNVTQYMWQQQDQTAPRTLYSSGGGNFNPLFRMYYSGGIYTQLTYGTAWTLRIQGLSTTTYGDVFFRRLA